MAQMVRWLVWLPPMLRLVRDITRSPKMRQVSQMPKLRKPKKMRELLEVEKSQTTGANPTSRSEVMARKVNRIPVMLENLTSQVLR